MRSLIAAALEDQERRVREARPLELAPDRSAVRGGFATCLNCGAKLGSARGGRPNRSGYCSGPRCVVLRNRATQARYHARRATTHAASGKVGTPAGKGSPR